MTHGHSHHDNPITRLVGKLRRNSHPDGGPDAYSPSPDRRATRKMIRTPSLRSSKHSSPDKPHAVADAPASLALWTAAYDALRDSPASAGLVVAYESIVAQELPDHCKVGGLNTTLRDHPDSRRLELVAAIADAGLRKRRSTGAPEDPARAILDASKDSIGMMLGLYPSTALAWCGVCVLTPLLLDPLIQKHDVRASVLYVTGRIPFFMFLSQLLLPDGWRAHREHAAHHERARAMLLALYRRVLEFEMNCVCATAASWNMAAKNVVDWHGLVGMDQGIRRDAADLLAFVREHCTEAVVTRLAGLDKDLELPQAAEAAMVGGPQELAEPGAPGASSAGPSSAGFTQIRA